MEQHLRPLLKWAGGKRSQVERIVSLFPEEYGDYHELFFGGGAVFFHIAPVWGTDGTLYWAELDEAGEAEVCELGSAASAFCRGVGSARIGSLTVGNIGPIATIDAGFGQWEVVEL